MPEIKEVLPKYLQIAAHIRDQIVRGDLNVGDEVPSERRLAKDWNVARPTAAKALDALESQGLVVSERGSGTYVSDSNAAPRTPERYRRAADLGGMYGAAESVHFVATEITTAPEHVAQSLQLEPGSRVIRRARLLRAASGRSIELSTSWFDATLADAAPGLLIPERLVGGTAKYLAGVTGRKASYARDKVASRLAEPDERELLGLADPSAVLVYAVVIFAAKDEPIQCDDAVYPPGEWTFHSEYPLR
jgi:DNA-binding GntR family transcriptional regulator